MLQKLKHESENFGRRQKIDDKEKRCIWSGESSVNLKVIEVEMFSGVKEMMVIPKFEELTRSYFQEVKKNEKRFLVGIAGLPLFITLFIILQVVFSRPDSEILFSALALLVFTGAVLWRYPFATPETIARFGISKSKKIVRSVAVILIITGLIFMLYVIF